MIHPLQFEAEIVRPTLNLLGGVDPRLATEASVVLMMGTAAQESDLGFYLRQWPKGPGKGPWQVEDATHEDVHRYLDRPSNNRLQDVVTGMSRHHPTIPHRELIVNFCYSCAIARIKFWMVPAALPEADDLFGLGQYWDKWFNANARHGTPDEWVKSYKKFVLLT